MRTTLRVVLSGFIAVVMVESATAQTLDVAAIEQVQVRQADAWNRGDAKAYADLFVDDGDVVNVLGWWWRGKGEIETKLTDAFAWVFRDSTLHITEVHVRPVSATIAIAHVRWELDGANAPPGAPTPPREGIQLQVLQNVDGEWLIVSFQNTNSIPEHPFPPGPPQ